MISLFRHRRSCTLAACQAPNGANASRSQKRTHASIWVYGWHARILTCVRFRKREALAPLNVRQAASVH
eukprot:6753750-Pyramimonas_sp.AAC.1